MRLAGLLLVVIAVMGGIGYWYYNDTQERISILQANNAQLNIAVQTSEQALESVQADYARASSELTALNQEYASIRRQNQELATKLADLDLTAAAITNPTAIERAVNRGTENAGRCFELLSGAELTENERNATDARSFNKECPWLYDSFRTRGLLNSTAAD